jgi:hypothetical protein
MSTHIDAPPEVVWPIILDVKCWHEWTASIRSIELLQPGELAVGSKVRIRQPKLPPVVWTVTVLEPGRLLQWEVSSPGSRSVAIHRVDPDGDGSKATLGIDQRGLFFALTGWYFNKITRTYVNTELDGLKRRSETRS